jgi:hypothetical protein
LISPTQPRSGIGRVQKRGGFLAGQELHGASLKPFEGHRQHLLAVTRHGWLIQANIPEEGVYGAHPAVTSASAVVAILLKVLEESAHQLGIQVLYLQVTGLTLVMLGSKFEQQSEGVAITGDRMGAGAQLSEQSVGKEPL